VWLSYEYGFGHRRASFRWVALRRHVRRECSQIDRCSTGRVLCGVSDRSMVKKLTLGKLDNVDVGGNRVSEKDRPWCRSLDNACARRSS